MPTTIKSDKSDLFISAAQAAVRAARYGAQGGHGIKWELEYQFRHDSLPLSYQRITDVLTPLLGADFAAAYASIWAGGDILHLHTALRILEDKKIIGNFSA